MKSFPNPKINLGLSVLCKRPDGFHDLETLFVPYFGMSDILEIEPLSGGSSPGETSASLHPSQPCGWAPPSHVPEGGQALSGAAASGEKVRIEIAGPRVDWDPMKDLTVKAYDILDADFDLPPVAMRLTKNVPVGAGLGGGSSDAAFALRMLNEMFSLGLDDGTLAGYASRLGSDCAFFIYNHPMFGTGRGEVLTPYEIDLSSYELRVEVPSGVSVSTVEAYRGVLAVKLNRQEGKVPGAEARPLAEVLKMPVPQWKDFLVNDFEATVFPLHPEIPALKRKMYEEGAVYASMSGSGSSVFGLFEKR